jgi:hypothetical protein
MAILPMLRRHTARLFTGETKWSISPATIRTQVWYGLSDAPQALKIHSDQASAENKLNVGS